jgi:hypothetical protein
MSPSDASTGIRARSNTRHKAMTKRNADFRTLGARGAGEDFVAWRNPILLLPPTRLLNLD